MVFHFNKIKYDNTLSIKHSGGFLDNVDYKVFYPIGCFKSFIENIVFFKRPFNGEKQLLQPISNGKIEMWLTDEAYTCQVQETGLEQSMKAFIIGMNESTQPLYLIPGFSESSISGCVITFTLKGVRELLNTEPLELKNKIVDAHTLKVLDVDKYVSKWRETDYEYDKLTDINTYIHDLMRCRSKIALRSAKAIYNALLKITIEDSVSSVCKKAHVSYRTLNRFFREHIGYSPKEYLKMIRFDKVCKHMSLYPDCHWSDIIQAFGYYDQAHMIRDFKNYCGVTPSGLQRKRNVHFFINRSFMVV